MFNNQETITKEVQQNISPIEAIQILKTGNERFLNNTALNRNLNQQVRETASGQFPFAAIISCIDSRIPTEIVFDQGVGDIFNARIAGNFINEDIIGSMEFACAVAGSKLIVVMGHTSCGAVKGACDNVELGNLTQMLDKIKPAVNGVKTDEETDRSSKNLEFVNQVAQKNVELSIQNIKKNSATLNKMLEEGKINIVGAMYHVETGEVTFH